MVSSDEKEERKPPARSMTIMVLLLAHGYRRADGPGAVALQRGSARHPAANPPQPALSLDPTQVAAGKALFARQDCINCHRVGGKGGGDLGPDLSGTGTRNPDLDWQIRHLKEPSSVEEGSTMPSYKKLSEADLRALAIYMLSLK